MKQTCVLNISGTKVEVEEGVFSKLSSSLKKGGYLDGSEMPKEIFIGRNLACFESILHYYQCGDLHFPQTLCPGMFKTELEFWDIPASSISKCCNYKFFSFLETYSSLEKYETYTARWKKNITKIKGESKGFRERMWDIVDNPYSSRKAKVYMGLLTFFVVFSISLMCFATEDSAYRALTEREFAENYNEDWPATYASYLYDIFGPAIFEEEYPELVNNNSNLSNISTEEPRHKPMTRISAITTLEYICVAFFTVDLILRFLVYQSLRTCCTDIANIVDVVALAGSYTRVLVVSFAPSKQYTTTLVNMIDLVNVARICRLVRILCHITTLRVLVYSLKNSLTQLIHMLVLLFGMVVFFSTVLYVCEDEKLVPNIPHAFWWGVITMTTVGYGDVIPKTIQGKITACVCSIMGVIMLALTIAIVVNDFVAFSDFAKANYEVDNENSESKPGPKSEEKQFDAIIKTPDKRYPSQTETMTNI